MSTITYRVSRHFQREGVPAVTIRTGLSLEEAQAHCRNPETSSLSSTQATAYTRKHGSWYDGYTREQGE